MTSLSTSKFDYVISFGCSLAWGAELENRNKRYAKLVANKYNATLIDYSVPGNSNENISQAIINVLLANKAVKHPARVLVLVGWSYAKRLNYCGKKNRYYVVAEYNLDPDRRKRKLSLGHNHVYFNDDFDDPMDVRSYYQYHTNLTYLLYNTSKHIHHAQMFLKNNGYNYIFSFADNAEKNLIMSPQESYDLLQIKFPFTNSTYPNFGYLMNDIDRTHICNTAFTNFCQQQNFKIGSEFHPLEEGHAAYANVLIDFIESKYGEQ